MKKITPNLWFKGNAEEAVDFYLSVFKDGKVVNSTNSGVYDLKNNRRVLHQRLVLQMR